MLISLVISPANATTSTTTTPAKTTTPSKSPAPVTSNTKITTKKPVPKPTPVTKKPIPVDNFGDPIFDSRTNKTIDPWLTTFVGYLLYNDQEVSSNNYDFNTMYQDYYNLRGDLYDYGYAYDNILTPEEIALGVSKTDPMPAEFVNIWSTKTKLWYCYADIRYLDNKAYAGKPLQHRLLLESCEEYLSTHNLTLPSLLKDSYVKSNFDSYKITTDYPTINLPQPLNNGTLQLPLNGGNIYFTGSINDNSQIQSITIKAETKDSSNYGVIYHSTINQTPILGADNTTYTLTIPLNEVISEAKSHNSLTNDPVCNTVNSPQIWRLHFTITLKSGAINQGYFDTYIARNPCLK